MEVIGLSARMASVDLWHLWENIRVPNGHSTFHIPHPSFHTFKRPLVHEVFAKVGSLLALDALLLFTRFGGVGNHADGVRDIINGKNVVAPIREIQEVKNAIKTYEMYPHLDAFKEEDLLKAHAQMMEAIIDNPGRYFVMFGYMIFGLEKSSQFIRN